MYVENIQDFEALGGAGHPFALLGGGGGLCGISSVKFFGFSSKSIIAIAE